MRRFKQMNDEEGNAASMDSCCFYGWTVWLVLTIGQMTTFFGTSSGVTFVLDDVMAELKLSRSMASLSYAGGTFVGAAAQIPIGRAVDRFGGRRSVAVCSAAFYLSLAGMSLPQDWYMLTLAFIGVRALGFGGLAMACTTCLQQWFVRRRGLATGLSECMNTLFGFGLNSQLYAIAVESFGWRASYLIIGLVLLVYPPVAALLLRSRPEDMGLLPDGGQARSVASRTDGEAASSKTSSAAATVGWTLREAMGTTSLWIIVAANALQWGIGAGLFFHLASVVVEFGLPAELLPSSFYLPWAIARATALAVGGFLLDRAPPRFIMFVGFLLGGVSMLALGWPHSQLTPLKTAAIAALWGLSMVCLLPTGSEPLCPSHPPWCPHAPSAVPSPMVPHAPSTVPSPMVHALVTSRLALRAAHSRALSSHAPRPSARGSERPPSPYARRCSLAGLIWAPSKACCRPPTSRRRRWAR
jgi:sugar phosphate permease